MSMSTIYGIMAVLPHVLRFYNPSNCFPAAPLVVTMRIKVKWTFWCPERELDGKVSFNLFHGVERKPYLQKVQTISEKLLNQSHKLFVTHPRCE